MDDAQPARYQIHPEQAQWLVDMVKRYDLADQDKALRIVLTHAMSEGDEAQIFGEIRCRHC